MKSKEQHQSPIYISRSYEEDVVMLSTSYCKNIAETAYLLKSPGNVSRFMEGIEEYKKVKAKRKIPKTPPIRNDMMWKGQA